MNNANALKKEVVDRAGLRYSCNANNLALANRPFGLTAMGGVPTKLANLKRAEKLR